MVVVPSANMMRDASFMDRPSAPRHCGGQRLAIDLIRAQIEATWALVVSRGSASGALWIAAAGESSAMPR